MAPGLSLITFVMLLKVNKSPKDGQVSVVLSGQCCDVTFVQLGGIDP